MAPERLAQPGNDDTHAAPDMVTLLVRSLVPYPRQIDNAGHQIFMLSHRSFRWPGFHFVVAPTSSPLRPCPGNGTERLSALWANPPTQRVSYLKVWNIELARRHERSGDRPNEFHQFRASPHSSASASHVVGANQPFTGRSKAAKHLSQGCHSCATRHLNLGNNLVVGQVAIQIYTKMNMV